MEDVNSGLNKNQTPRRMHSSEESTLNTSSTAAPGNDIGMVNNAGTADQYQKQAKRLCRFGKTCANKVTCQYSHDPVNKMCRFGERCIKKDACLFSHMVAPHQNYRNTTDNRNWGAYKDGIDGRNRRQFRGYDDSVHHPGTSGWNGGSYGLNEGEHEHLNIHNQRGEGRGRKLSAGDGNDVRRRLCKHGTKCIAGGNCSFNHEMISKPCRYGDRCDRMKLGKCLFNHQSNQDKREVNEDISRWLINSKNGNGHA